ncbi:hypothetical protein H8356DRAFT_1331158 [Neocallimastix lanati (nom. inval.)]|nr:hypothetical protein H8356DRAFT_1331158 [Neocallimastix sp. JGI-2020a]
MTRYCPKSGPERVALVTHKGSYALPHINTITKCIPRKIVLENLSNNVYDCPVGTISTKCCNYLNISILSSSSPLTMNDDNVHFKLNALNLKDWFIELNCLLIVQDCYIYIYKEFIYDDMTRKQIKYDNAVIDNILWNHGHGRLPLNHVSLHCPPLGFGYRRSLNTRLNYTKKEKFYLTDLNLLNFSCNTEQLRYVSSSQDASDNGYLFHLIRY